MKEYLGCFGFLAALAVVIGGVSLTFVAGVFFVKVILPALVLLGVAALVAALAFGSSRGEPRDEDHDADGGRGR